MDDVDVPYISEDQNCGNLLLLLFQWVLTTSFKSDSKILSYIACLVCNVLVLLFCRNDKNHCPQQHLMVGNPRLSFWWWTVWASWPLNVCLPTCYLLGEVLRWKYVAWLQFSLLSGHHCLFLLVSFYCAHLGVLLRGWWTAIISTMSSVPFVLHVAIFVVLWELPLPIWMTYKTQTLLTWVLLPAAITKTYPLSEEQLQL